MPHDTVLFTLYRALNIVNLGKKTIKNKYIYIFFDYVKSSLAPGALK